MYPMSLSVCGTQRTTFEKWFSPSIHLSPGFSGSIHPISARGAQFEKHFSGPPRESAAGGWVVSTEMLRLQLPLACSTGGCRGMEVTSSRHCLAQSRSWMAKSECVEDGRTKFVLGLSWPGWLEGVGGRSISDKRTRPTILLLLHEYRNTHNTTTQVLTQDSPGNVFWHTFFHTLSTFLKMAVKVLNWTFPKHLVILSGWNMADDSLHCLILNLISNESTFLKTIIYLCYSESTVIG